jgi:hypothetical protein
MQFTPTFNGVQTGTVLVSTNATNEDLGIVEIDMTGTGQYNSTVPTVTTLSVSPTTTYSGQPVMMSATVTGAGGTPTTYVSFYSGLTLLGKETLTNGTTSVLTTTALAVGTDPIKAVYNGDPTYNPSSSAVTNVTVYAGPPNFTVTPATLTETTQAGLSINDAIAVQAINGYSGSPALTCLGLPTFMTCTFSPSTVTLATNAKYNVLLTIATTTTPPAINGMLKVAGGVTVCLLAPLFLALLPGRRKRLTGLLCVLCGIALVGMQGCSGTTGITTKVATGTYSVVVQGKDANGLTNTATISVAVQ